MHHSRYYNHHHHHHFRPLLLLSPLLFLNLLSTLLFPFLLPLLLFPIADASATLPPPPDVGDFDWDTITPTRDLVFRDCYYNSSSSYSSSSDGKEEEEGLRFQCARLLVPLDWREGVGGGDDDGDDGRRARGTASEEDEEEEEVALAIIKLLPTEVEEELGSAAGKKKKERKEEKGRRKFGGTLFVNPGGPGGSGVEFLLRDGGMLRGVVNGGRGGDGGEEDEDEEEGTYYYEILSWDPRGVGRTTPRVDCFGSSGYSFDADDDDGENKKEREKQAIMGLEARWEMEIMRRGIGSVGVGLGDYGGGGGGGGGGPLHRQLARAKGFGEVCRRSGGGDGEGKKKKSVLPYVSTPFVVRDMVEILDQLREERKGRREREIIKYNDEVRIGDGGTQIILHGEDTEDEDVERLLYWGFSYGSILGNTFASMYPGRVGRMILDGIADANDYMAGTWLTNLQDTDELRDYFYSSCFSAGLEKCPLRHENDKNWTDISARVSDLRSRLDSNPAIVFLPSPSSSGGDDNDPYNNNNPEILTGSSVLEAFRRPLYSMDQFPSLASTLASATLDNNLTSLALALNSARRPRSPFAEDEDAFCFINDDDADEDDNNNKPKAVVKGRSKKAARIASASRDASTAILCSDAEEANRLDHPDKAIAYVRELQRQSEVLGTSWAEIRLECAGWENIHSKWRFTGPFESPEPSSSSSSTGHPLAPLLFLSSKLDPVTPLRNAIRMSGGGRHPGSRVVVQEGAVGHCSSAPRSRCVRGVIRRYLATGEVPSSSSSSSSSSSGGGEEGKEEEEEEEGGLLFFCNSECGAWDEKEKCGFNWKRRGKKGGEDGEGGEEEEEEEGVVDAVVDFELRAARGGWFW